MKLNHYMDAQLEGEYGIAFHRPPQKLMRLLHNRLEKIGDELGVDDIPSITPPPKGFLQRALDTNQKILINRELSLAYADKNIEHQNQLNNVPINERYEAMVSLPEIMREHGAQVSYSEKKFHRACGPFANQERIWFVRMEVAHSLAKIFKALNSVDIVPNIEDAWRPEPVQRGLLIRRIAKIARQNPDWDWRQVHKFASSLTAPSPGLAGHMAGAAVDLTLQRRQKKGVGGHQSRRLHLGNEYAEGSVMSSLEFPYVTYHQWETRTLFANAMRMGGFRLLLTENWHASMNDRGLGIDDTVTMRRAVYGPIKHFNRKTGSIAAYNKDIVDEVFLTESEVCAVIESSRVKDSSRRYFINSIEDIVGYLDGVKNKQ